jgi:hypothetical protein
MISLYKILMDVLGMDYHKKKETMDEPIENHFIKA